MVLTATTPEKAETCTAPRHVAIIMDGNGRWAKKRLLNRSLGHKRGAEAVREAIEGAADAGVDYLTLFAFSSENWNRPVQEVHDLMGLLKGYLGREVKDLHEQNVRLKVIGNRSKLSADILKLIEDAEQLTLNNSRLTLIIALSYGSREEIAQATRIIAERVSKGEIRPEEITETTISQELYTKDIPEPDLIIRTSGEQRLSNFLLWQAAYSEFLFLDVLWPDFKREHFLEAVNAFMGRERRYGLRP